MYPAKGIISSPVPAIPADGIHWSRRSCDGKTDAITYVKAGSESSTKGAFSDDEIQMLLKINGSVKRGSDRRLKQAYKNGKLRIENSRQFTQNQSFL
jgi:hypothetical protein